MFNLPTELTLQILSYLPIASLSRLRNICKSWNEFCTSHEDTIHRNAAFLHAYIPSPTTKLNELGSLYSKRALEGVKNWKDLSRKRLRIQHNWKGDGPSTIAEHKSTSLDWTRIVHRIKVDELAGYIITTSSNRGLLVASIDEDRILWALPRWYVRRYAHLEYGQGYIIFDRHNGDKEVWRRLCDVVVDGPPTPDPMQCEAYSQVCEAYPHAMNGHFQPWTVLHMPEPTSAFRFVYPTLLVASQDRLYLWDIPSGKLIQTLEDVQFPAPEDNEDLGNIRYVEISERHVFVAGQFRLRVFSRATGKSVVDLSSSRQDYGLWRYAVTSVSSHSRSSGSALERYEVMAAQKRYGRRDSPIRDIFIAVHVSACGCHFAALLNGCRLIIVYDFEQASNEEEIYVRTLDIEVASDQLYESVYLAYDYGRISVVTTNGVFIIEVDESTRTDISNEAPRLTICCVFQLAHEPSLEAVSCLMMSDTGLYLNWNPTAFVAYKDDDHQVPSSGNTNIVPQNGMSSVFSVNFAL